MAAEPTIAVLSIAPERWRNRAVLLYAAMADYWALTKPEVNFLIAITTFAGFYLALAVNALASLLAVLTLVSYLFLYTPLKRKTPLCTLVVAFPGAMPPLIGWAAAAGGLSLEAWVLYAMLFLWQFPHLMAIAWMYRGTICSGPLPGRLGD